MNLCIKKSVITNVYLFILKCHMFKIGIMSVINNVYFNFFNVYTILILYNFYVCILVCFYMNKML